MAVLDGVAVRGRDLEKGKHGHMEWEQREVVFECDGHTIERIRTPNDLQKEGELRGHCAGAHAYWVSKDVEYLFSYRNEFGVPKATIHCRPKELINVKQDEDKTHEFNYYDPAKIDGLKCGYPSTYYDYANEGTITYEGRELVVISKGYYRGYGETEPSEREKHIQAWFDSLDYKPHTY